MRAINIANSAKRDAQVGFVSSPKQERAFLGLPDGRRPVTTRFVKSVASIDALSAEYGGLEQVGQAMVDADPEIDIETVGKLIERPLRVYVSADGHIAYRVRMEQVVYNADGSERERRELAPMASNVAAETPITWSKRSLDKAEAVHRFAFSRSYQLTHTNGLTFDFLYQMAAELQAENSLRLVGSGPQGTGPLILTTGGDPYRGFLEGRVDGQRYSLVLHLSNSELRALSVAEVTE